MLKAVKRTPHVLTSKVGMAKSSSDVEVDELKRRFTAVEEESAKLLKDAKAYREAVSKMLISSHNFGQAYITLLSPMSNELDLPERYPAASQTIEQMSNYQELITDLKQTVQPELDLIDSQIIAPIKEYLEIIKRAKKAITKRDHKLIDFDRHNNSYIKLRDKKDKTLKDEQNIFKVEKDYEAALQDYEHYNNLLKTDLPQFLELTTSFISPLFHSFFYMQLNILYTTFGKLQQFAEGRFDLNQMDIIGAYQERLGQTPERIEALSIVKRPISTAKVMADRRAAAGDTSALRPTPSSASIRVPLGSNSSVGSLSAPPPLSAKPSFDSKASLAKPSPPLLAAKPNLSPSVAPKPSLTPKPSISKPGPSIEPPSPAAPPPYTPPTAGGIGSVAAAAAALSARQSVAAPPAVKPKLKPPPPPPQQQSLAYVTALYDFEAQAEGDLSFKAGDRIEVVKRTDSEEDWWTGRVGGVEGVFPGNYVQG